MKFEWIPGTPLNHDTLECIKQQFPKPDEPPPQGFLMGEIAYYPFVIEQNPLDFDYEDMDWFSRRL